METVRKLSRRKKIMLSVYAFFWMQVSTKTRKIFLGIHRYKKLGKIGTKNHQNLIRQRR